MSSWSRNRVIINRSEIKRPVKETTIGITVCVNFSDKLRLSLEVNTLLLKKIYVVTDPTDRATINLCSQFKNVEVLLCADAFKNGAKFNKSGLIKFTQIKITPNHRNDWIIIIDADTILPMNFWSESILVKSKYSEDTVYLLKRKIYKTREDLQNDSYSEIQHGCGFFQMYFNKARMYSDFSENAGVCDMLFQQLFRKQEELEGFCLHIGQNGLDWNGRISNEWI